MRQGFYYNEAICIGCRACQIACCDKNDLDPTITFREVHTYEVGTYPNARAFHYSMSCNHCETPACVAACPGEAMYIDEDDGTIQHDDSKCIECDYCVEACPYSVPRLIEELGTVRKCDACIQLRKNGEQPACVAICPMRAIEFGPIDELRAAHPDAVNKIAVLPDPSKTNPSVAIDPRPAALEEDFTEMLV